MFLFVHFWRKSIMKTSFLRFFNRNKNISNAKKNMFIKKKKYLSMIFLLESDCVAMTNPHMPHPPHVPIVSLLSFSSMRFMYVHYVPNVLFYSFYVICYVCLFMASNSFIPYIHSSFDNNKKQTLLSLLIFNVFSSIYTCLYVCMYAFCLCM